MTHIDSHDHGSEAQEPVDSAYWDERYSAEHQLWSGDPNQALVAAVETLHPGRGLDIGCGEGADAVWLARNGWRVTGLDVSAVALERAAGHALTAGVSVTWVHSGFVEAGFASASFDLVSAQYPVLKKSQGKDAERLLIELVAPGGSLVFVHHADFQSTDHDHRDFSPADYLGPWDLVPLLREGWHIEVNETRPRHLTAGAGAGHADDAVLVARRDG